MHPQHTPLVTIKRAFFALAFLVVGSFSFAQTAPSINIAWDDNSPGIALNGTSETGFEIWRSQGLGSTTYTVLATTAANVVTYSDLNLPYSTVFNYKVRAVNSTFTPPLQSAFSNIASGTTPADPIAPSAPSGLVASSVMQTSLSLAWTAATDNVGVTGYRITRNGTLLKTVTTTSTTDSGLTAATAYTYTIIALDAAGNVSSTAATVSVTTLAPTPPVAPSNVTATVVP